jgi:hypothetical protein
VRALEVVAGALHARADGSNQGRPDAGGPGWRNRPATSTRRDPVSRDAYSNADRWDRVRRTGSCASDDVRQLDSSQLDTEIATPLSFTASQVARRGVDHRPRRILGTHTEAGPFTLAKNRPIERYAHAHAHARIVTPESKRAKGGLSKSGHTGGSSRGPRRRSSRTRKGNEPRLDGFPGRRTESLG